MTRQVKLLFVELVMTTLNLFFKKNHCNNTINKFMVRAVNNKLDEINCQLNMLYSETITGKKKDIPQFIATIIKTNKKLIELFMSFC